MLWDLETFLISLLCLGLVAGLFVSEGWGFVYLRLWESRWEAGPFQRWKLLRPDANTSGCQQPGPPRTEAPAPDSEAGITDTE